MNNNSSYKLVGILNLYGVYPDFVYPVFKKDDKYYFQCSENCLIKSFKEIKEKFYIQMIKLLDINKETSMTKKEYSVGEEQIIAFQINKDNFLISNSTDFVPFISNFDTDDHILREEIDSFLYKVNNMKNNKKRILLNRNQDKLS